jgi:DNA polymerase V
MCAPIFQVRHLLDRNNGVALSSNYTLYDDLSWRFQSCLEDFTPDVEHYAIDEVFVKMPMSSWHTLTEIGREMKNQVRALTGISVSIGFGDRFIGKLGYVVVLANIHQRLDRLLPLVVS